MRTNIARHRGSTIAFVIVSVGLAIGAFVPLLVNFLTAGRFDWSLYVLSAVVMTWLIVAPWFIFRHNRATISWVVAAVSVPLFLWLVESLGTDKGWLLPLGLPSAVQGLAALGGIVWLWCHSRIKVWYALALTVFLLALVSLTEQALARPFLVPDPIEWVRNLVTFCLGGVSVGLALVALLVHGPKVVQES